MIILLYYLCSFVLWCNWATEEIIGAWVRTSNSRGEQRGVDKSRLLCDQLIGGPPFDCFCLLSSVQQFTLYKNSFILIGHTEHVTFCFNLQKTIVLLNTLFLILKMVKKYKVLYLLMGPLVYSYPTTGPRSDWQFTGGREHRRCSSRKSRCHCEGAHRHHGGHQDGAGC